MIHTHSLSSVIHPQQPEGVYSFMPVVTYKQSMYMYGCYLFFFFFISIPKLSPKIKLFCVLVSKVYIFPKRLI